VNLVLTVLLALLTISPGQSPTESALSSDQEGWVDLLADTTLKDWRRVALGAVGQLPAGDVSQSSPWSLSGETLVCEGNTSGHEMLRYGPELGDFVLHVEWRVAELEKDEPYNSGVFVRTGADGVVWHQAQTALTGGYLFGNTLVNGTMQRVNLRDAMTENRVKPAGNWNTYEIRAVGKIITLSVNGAVTSEFSDCEVPRGHIGLEAEGYRIEFKNVRLKHLQ
jgi:hypothetical protein